MPNHLIEIKITNLPDKVFIELALQAHMKNMTLNDFIIMILDDFVETELSAVEGN